MQCIVIDLNKKVEIINLPASIAWLNKDNDPVAWFKNGTIHTKHEMNENIECLPISDDHAKYYLCYQNKEL